MYDPSPATTRFPTAAVKPPSAPAAKVAPAKSVGFPAQARTSATEHLGLATGLGIMPRSSRG